LTLLTVVLTGSPLLFKKGRQLAYWVLVSVIRIPRRFVPQILLMSAVLALTLVLAFWFIGRPRLAIRYNSEGIEALQSGDITAARRSFQRSTALDPGPVVPYFNLGDAYAEIGLRDEAILWYRQALEQDSNLRLAYARLGHQYNQQGDYATARPILLAGLALEPVADDEGLVVLTEYELLSNLGWTYFAQEEYEQAHSALQAAVALEPQLAALERAARDAGQQVQYEQALPHYYLARVYEELNELEQARCAWEDTLRYVDSENWQESLWHQQATQRIQELGRCTP
jgi:tetratricopeptide (TPR) repeat protein